MVSEGTLVSVVIPTFNRAGLLERAVQSVLAQTHSHLEILIIDDGSTDDTESVVRRFGDSRISYLKKTNSGAPAARNVGISQSKGDFVAFLDSDDEWLPKKTELQLRKFQQTKLCSTGVVTCGGNYYNHDGIMYSSSTPKMRGWLFEQALGQTRIIWGPPFLMVRRNVLVEHNIRFDENLPARQGWDFATQLAKVCQFDFVPEPLVVVHNHAGEHVFTHERAVQASLYLHDKYIDELTPRPSAHFRFHIKTALECLSLGNSSLAKEQVREAIAVYPGRPLGYLWRAALAGKCTPQGRIRRLVLKILSRLTFKE